MTINDFLLKIKYPKLILLLLTFVLAYLIIRGNHITIVHDFIVSLGYAGTFIFGMLFAYGFTAAPATAGLLIIAEEQNIFLAAAIAGAGALAADLIIFKFIRHSFLDEIQKIMEEKFMLLLSDKTPYLIKKYFLPVFAGALIASPLPDEIGVSLLASFSNFSTKTFSLIAFALNTLGIFIILFIGKNIF